MFLKFSLWKSCPFLLAYWTKRLKLDPCYHLLKINWKALMEESEKSGRTLRGFAHSRKGKIECTLLKIQLVLHFKFAKATIALAKWAIQKNEGLFNLGEKKYWRPFYLSPYYNFFFLWKTSQTHNCNCLLFFSLDR